MYPYIHIVIPSYAAMAAIGGFVTMLFVYFRIERMQIEFTEFLKIFAVGVLGIVIGSKLLFAITQIPWLLENFNVKNMLLLIPQSGYVFYGGLLGFIASILIYTKKKLDYREKIFRLIVPGMPLFHAFGRIGCFLSGCCYGKELNTRFEFVFFTIERIPVQLIEAFLEVIIFLVILVIDKKKEVDLLAWYLLMYATVRFVLEFFRGDVVRGIYLGLSTSQWISLIIILYYAVKRIRRKEKCVELSN